MERYRVGLRRVSGQGRSLRLGYSFRYRLAANATEVQLTIRFHMAALYRETQVAGAYVG
jgi:hypothetical protein